jgi:hypothetical protein
VLDPCWHEELECLSEMAAQDISGPLLLFQLAQACNRGCGFFAQFEGGKPCSCHVRIEYMSLLGVIFRSDTFQNTNEGSDSRDNPAMWTKKMFWSSVPCEKGPQRLSSHAIAVHGLEVEKDEGVKNYIRGRPGDTLGHSPYVSRASGDSLSLPED